MVSIKVSALNATSTLTDNDVFYVVDGSTSKKVNFQDLTNNINKNSKYLVKTSNYTAASGERVLADTSSSSWTLTLPGSPAQGDFVRVVDIGTSWATNNLTIDGNGNTIEGASSFTADVDEGSLEIIWTGGDWIVRFFGPTT